MALEIDCVEDCVEGVVEATEESTAVEMINGDGQPVEGQPPVERSEQSEQPSQNDQPTQPASNLAVEISPEDRLLAEKVHEADLIEAKEKHSQLALDRSKMEAELKDLKASEKVALQELKNLLNRGPSYPKPITKIEEAVANSEPSAIQVDDANADTTWKLIPTSNLLIGLKGMGDKKANAIIELAPTLGDMEELRAKAGLAHKPFASVLPRGVGQNMADEIEERIYMETKRHAQAIEKAASGDVDDEMYEAEEDSDTEAEENELDYSDV